MYFAILAESCVDANKRIQEYANVSFVGHGVTRTSDDDTEVLSLILLNPNSFRIRTDGDNKIIRVQNLNVVWNDRFPPFNIVLEKLLQTKFVSIKDDGRIVVSLSGLFRLWIDMRGSHEKYTGDQSFCWPRGR